MQACENVIVTVVLPGEQLDMELPAFLPAAELCRKLAETLRAYRPELYGSVFQLTLRSGQRFLKENETLASLGIWDGSIIHCELQKEVL